MTKTLGGGGGNPHQKSLGEEIWATLDPLLKTLERCTGPRVFKQWPLRYQLHLLQLSQLLAQPSHLWHCCGRERVALHSQPSWLGCGATLSLSLSHNSATSGCLGEQLGQAQLLLPEDASGAGSIETKRKKKRKEKCLQVYRSTWEIIEIHC